MCYYFQIAFVIEPYSRAQPDWAYEFSDQTPKFDIQVLLDRTKSGLIFLNILHAKYELSILLR